MITYEDLFEFASTIDDIVAVGDLDEFAKKHQKLVQLYNQLYQYGLVPEYEYAYHRDSEVIPGIVFYPFTEDELDDPGLSGIMVISIDEHLRLMATDTIYSFNAAIESNITDADDFLGFSEYYNNGYMHDVFDTDSVSDMAAYLSCLSTVQFTASGMLVPITKDRVATYWTKMLGNGKVSFDRVTIFRISQENCEDDEDDEFEYECKIGARLNEHEEEILIDRLTAIKEIISEISKNYIKGKQ